MLNFDELMIETSELLYGAGHIDTAECAGYEVLPTGEWNPLVAPDMATMLLETDPFQAAEWQGWIYWQNNNGTLSL